MVCFQYLRLVREMEGYGSVVFPNCVCDSRKDGHVIPIVGFNSFKLQACTEDGTKEVERLLSLLH
jgi:sorting nexin-27